MSTKTLAQLKRDLQVGTKMKCTQHAIKPERVGVEREIKKGDLKMEKHTVEIYANGKTITVQGVWVMKDYNHKIIRTFKNRQEGVDYMDRKKGILWGDHYLHFERDPEEEAHEEQKETLRQYAIDTQNFISNMNLSYGDIEAVTEIFRNLAEEYDLVEELQENGVI